MKVPDGLRDCLKPQCTLWVVIKEDAAESEGKGRTADEKV